MSKPPVYTLQALLEQSVAEYGDHIHSTMGAECTVTYRSLGILAEELRNYLLSKGIRPGDKVALISENMPHWGVAYFGIASMGAVIVPVLVDFSAIEINNVLSHAEAKAILISKKVYGRLSTDLQFDGLCIQINDFTDLSDGVNLHVQAEKTLDDKDKIDVVRTRPDDLACIIYTSGTTGRSKGVMLTNENLVWDAIQCTTIHPVSHKDIVLSVLPLAHTYECTLGLILGTMQGTTTHYIDKAPTANVLMPLLKEIRPTMMLTVPLIIEKLFRVGVKPKLTKTAFMRFLYGIRPIQRILHKAAGKKLYRIFGGRLEFFGIGGAAVAPEVERFLRDARFPYSCGYGLTETSPMIFGASVAKTVFRSVGPVMQGIEAKLVNVNEETGEGEIVVRGKNIMKGYYKEPELTADVLDEEGWFRTGDLGVIDRKGNLTLKGRSKNMILGASGENIYPEEIEAIINEMDGVVESVVYQYKGKLVAQVYLNVEELTKKYHELLKSAHDKEEDLKKGLDLYLKELRVKVNQSVGKHAQLSDMQRRDEPFEKTATMKIKRFSIHQKEK